MAAPLQSVGDANNNRATYSYLANSLVVGQIVFVNNGTTRMTTAKQYDFLNRLTSISGVGPQPSTANSYNYQLNQANQLTRVTLADGSSWLYTYDSLGQVVRGHKFCADGTPDAAMDATYTDSQGFPQWTNILHGIP